MRRAQAKGDGSMDERVARLQQRAKAASERAAALRLVIEGPQPPEVSSYAGCGQFAAQSWDLESDLRYLLLWRQKAEGGVWPYSRHCSGIG